MRRKIIQDERYFETYCRWCGRTTLHRDTLFSTGRAILRTIRCLSCHRGFTEKEYDIG